MTTAETERAISGYPRRTMVSNVGRSKISLMVAEASSYAASKSSRRNASSWRMTVTVASATSGRGSASATPRPMVKARTASAHGRIDVTRPGAGPDSGAPAIR